MSVPCSWMRLRFRVATDTRPRWATTYGNVVHVWASCTQPFVYCLAARQEYVNSWVTQDTLVDDRKRFAISGLRFMQSECLLR